MINDLLIFFFAKSLQIKLDHNSKEVIDFKKKGIQIKDVRMWLADEASIVSLVHLLYGLTKRESDPNNRGVNIFCFCYPDPGSVGH